MSYNIKEIYGKFFYDNSRKVKNLRKNILAGKRWYDKNYWNDKHKWQEMLFKYVIV